MFRVSRVLRLATKPPPPYPQHLSPEQARPAFISACKNVLEKVKILPQEYAYREAVEKLYLYRLKVAEEETDVQKMESLIQGGEINQMIEIAEDEASLIPQLLAEKPWDLSKDADYETDDPDWVPFERKIYIQ